MVSLLRLAIPFWCLVTITARIKNRKNKRNRESAVDLTLVKSDVFRYIAVLADIVEENVTRTDCTCSIIAREWVLTSAECTPPNLRFEGSVYAWYNSYKQSPLHMKQMARVLNSFPHHSYRYSEQPKNRGVLHNIGLLRVDKIETSKYGILSAIDHTALSGLYGTYIGSTKPEQVVLMPNDKNEEELSEPFRIGTGVIFKCEQTKYGIKLMCIASRCSSDANATSYTYNGGPLLLDAKIAGVMLNAPVPNIGFTPVSPYLNWIQTVTSVSYDDQRKNQ